MSVEPWVDTKTVAEHTGKSVFTVRNRAKAGEWPGVKSGRDWIFQLSKIDAAIEAGAVNLYAQSPQSRAKRRAT